jgi:hypothetical protein
MIRDEEAKLIGHLGSVVHDLRRRVRIGRDNRTTIV